MQQQYDGWVKSTHHAVASCNDCHTPHDSLIAKMWVKSRNGFNHSWMFTTQAFHEPIQITPFNEQVTQQACRYCHSGITHAIDAMPRENQQLDCIRCHRNVGHLH